jgi:hypothetical protein
MPPYVVNASSSSDEENAPEAFSLVQSKRNARTQDDALKRFQANEKERQKERNRERDRKLKERAEKTRKTKSMQEGDMQARIKRAMRDANEEMDEKEEGEEEELEDDGDEEGSENEEDVEGSQSDMSSEEDEDMESAEDEEQSHDGDSSDESQYGINDSHSISQSSLAKPKQNPQHLPDHLFISAFAAQTYPSSSKQKSPPSVSQKTNNIKKRSHRVQAKDLIIG